MSRAKPFDILAGSYAQTQHRPSSKGHGLTGWSLPVLFY